MTPCGTGAGRDLGLAVWAMSWVSHSTSPGLSLPLSATLSVLGQDNLTRPGQFFHIYVHAFIGLEMQ